VQILGVSTDDVAANAKFAQEQAFPYPLLCDTERAICLAYGAVQSREDRGAKRISYVIGPDGKVLQAIGEVNARSHPEELLKTL
jgi:peroxiredoxin Q/BCP